MCYRRLTLCLTAVALVAGCGSPKPPGASSSGGGGSSSSSSSGATDLTGEVLTPGAEAKATIGPQGGHLAAPNGQVELTFPPGALASDTEITIQLVDLAQPNGNHHTIYQLLPDGLTFPKGAYPIFTYHYTARDLVDTTPDFLAAQFRTPDGRWIQVQSATANTDAQTIDVPLPHFSPWRAKASCTVEGLKAAVLTDHDMALQLVCDVQPPEKGAEPFTMVIGDPSTRPPNVWVRQQVSVEGVIGGNATVGTADLVDSGGIVYHAPHQAPADPSVGLVWQVWVTSTLPSDNNRLFHKDVAHTFHVVDRDWVLVFNESLDKMCGPKMPNIASYQYRCTNLLHLHINDDASVTSSVNPVEQSQVSLTSLESCQPSRYAVTQNIGQPGVSNLSATGTFNAALNSLELSYTFDFQDIPNYTVTPIAGDPHPEGSSSHEHVGPYAITPVSDGTLMDETTQDVDGAQKGEILVLNKG